MSSHTGGPGRAVRACGGCCNTAAARGPRYPQQHGAAAGGLGPADAPLRPRRLPPAAPTAVGTTWKLAGAARGARWHRADLRRKPPATTNSLRPHTRDYIAAVRRSFRPAAPALARRGTARVHRDNPSFPGMHEASALIAGGSTCRGQGDRRPARSAGRSTSPGAAPRDGRPGVGVLRLQRSGPCHQGVAGRAVSSGWRTSTSTSTTGTECRRHFMTTPGCSPSRCTRRRWRCGPGPDLPTECGRGAAVGTAVNVPVPAGGGRSWPAPSTRWCPSVITGIPPAGAGHPAWRGFPPRRSAGRLEPHRRRAAGRPSGVARPRRIRRKRAMAGPGRRRIRPGDRGAAGLDAPAGHWSSDRDVDPPRLIPEDGWPPPRRPAPTFAPPLLR